MSQRTALCLVNVSGKSIKSMSVKNAQGFENDGDFAKYLPGRLYPTMRATAAISKSTARRRTPSP